MRELRESREAVKTRDAKLSGEKEKPLVTLDLNLTFRLGWVDNFTNNQINMIGSFDW